MSRTQRRVLILCVSLLFLGAGLCVWAVASTPQLQPPDFQGVWQAEYTAYAENVRYFGDTLPDTVADRIRCRETIQLAAGGTFQQEISCERGEVMLTAAGEWDVFSKGPVSALKLEGMRYLLPDIPLQWLSGSGVDADIRSGSIAIAAPGRGSLLGRGFGPAFGYRHPSDGYVLLYPQLTWFGKLAKLAHGTRMDEKKVEYDRN